MRNVWCQNGEDSEAAAHIREGLAREAFKGFLLAYMHQSIKLIYNYFFFLYCHYGFQEDLKSCE